MFRPIVTMASCLALTLAAPSVAVADPSAGGGPPQGQIHVPGGSNGPQNGAARLSPTSPDRGADKRSQIISEAMTAVDETVIALKALDQGKNDEAIAALERATGKLDIILARDPALALAPSGVSEMTTATLADEGQVRALRRAAEKDLQAGRVQLARHILQGLASETVVSTTSIPLGTYPAALRHAAALIDDDKADAAKKVLQAALDTMVVTNTVIPIPIVTAQALLVDAKELAEKPNRTVDDNQNLNADLFGARQQLAYAEALGYGPEGQFQVLRDQLTEIASKTSDGKSGHGFFAKIEAGLSRMAQPADNADVKQGDPTQKGASAIK